MKQKIYRLFAFMMVLALIVTPVSANQVSEDVEPLDPESRPIFEVDSLPVSETGLYVIRLVDPALAAYSGGINNLAPTSPQVTGERKLDVSTPQSQAYLDYLQGKHSQFINQMNATLGRSVEVQFQYFNALNALAVDVSHEEALALVELPGVAAVYPDTLREIETDVGPTLIGAPTFWEGEFGFDEHRGEGVIVGMLDTGVNPVHPSFAEVDGDGYVHENPYGSGNFVGVCEDPADPDYEDMCNDKLIGAWNFHPDSPSAQDWNNHGSHVGSTIAGNKHDATFTVGSDVFTRTISGVAPRANVISYLVCFPSCPGTSSVAAVNQAIADGVDVLNYSISGGDSPWTDIVDLAFLDAFAAGMFVSASAGNDGPGPGTVAKTGPWNASVAASTHNRVIANTVDVTAPSPVPPELEGMAAVPGTGPAIVADIEAETIWAGDVDPGNVRGCNAFPAGSFTDAIALIQRGDCTFETKVTNATNAGAIAAIIYNHVGGPPIVMGGLEPTTIQSVFIDKDDGDTLVAFITGSPDPVEARINEATSVIVNDAWQDVMADFSSKGPSQWDLLKPDYTAPGVNILAAGFDGPDSYAFLQGTSMSSPHGAGAAALMVHRYPDWSPVEVKSALAMTGWQDLLKEDGVTPTDFLDMGSGRIDLTQGALIGLVMDETYENYVDANPATGGEPKTLNQPSMVDQNCVEECSWTRTVRSVLDDPATYNVVTEAPAGMLITVTPDTFTIAAGATQELVIDVTVDLDVLPVGDWAFAQVHLEVDPTPVLQTDVAPVRLPIAIVPFASAPIMTLDPEEITSIQDPNQVVTETLTIGNIGGVALEWSVFEDPPLPFMQPSQQPLGPSTPIVSGQLRQVTIGDNALERNSALPAGEMATFELPENVLDTVTITHSASQNIMAGNSVACSGDGGVTTTENGYLRTFVLEDFGIFSDFDIIEVSFGLENLSGTGQTLDVNIYTLDAEPFVYANMTLIATEAIFLDPQSLTIIDLPIEATIPAGSTLVVEVDWPDTSGVSGFLVGSNNLGQTAPSYLRSASCGLPEPIATGDIGFPGMHIVMNVTGMAEAPTCDAPGNVDWVDVDPLSGTVDPASSQNVSVIFDSTGLEAGEYTANLCLESNDPERPFAVVPLTLEVLASPTIEVDPESLISSQAVDTQVTLPLDILNTGLADLVWFIEESEGFADPMVIEPLNLPVGYDRANQPDTPPADPAPRQVLPTSKGQILSSWSEGFDDIDALPALGWAMINNSDPLGSTGWFQGNPVVFPAHSGDDDSYIAANFNNTSGVGTISNWLLTPEISMSDGDTFTFYTRKVASAWEDRLQVRLSTSGDSTDVGTGAFDVGVFDTLLLDINPDYDPGGYPTVWTQFEITLSGLGGSADGRLAFRYFVEDAGPLGSNSDYIGIDTFEYMAAPPNVLYDNGPIITSFGDGPGGADVSLLQNITLGMTTLGAAVYPSTGETFRMADDFTVTTPGGWTIENVLFYAYQTGSGTESTFTAVNYRIWDGPPDDPTSEVVYGDITTNRIEDTDWTNVYRYSESSPGTTRPVMWILGEADVHLEPGTYWIDWQLDGSLASGPWQPPITIIGETTTGDSMQFGSAGWVPFLDGGTGTHQGVPFQLWGLTVCDVPGDVSWLSVSPDSGITTPGEMDEVSVTFDSNGLEAGDYSAYLCVFSNDPNNPEIVVPVEMTVYEPTFLQVAHLAPFAEDASVTITFNGEPALVDFAYGDSTAYIELPFGEYDVAVIPTGAMDPAIEATVMLDADTYYTVVAVGDGVNQDLELILLVDDLTEPAEGKFHLRLGHLAPFASGEAVLADVRLLDGTPILENVDFGDVTAFIELDAGEYDLIITTPGGEVILINPLPVDFAEGMIISAFASGDGVNQDLGVFALPADAEGFFLPLSGPGLELTPAEDATSGEPGETVEFTLTLTNTGGVTDTFEINFAGNIWDVHLPEDSFTLNPGESADVIVHVTIPDDAVDSDFDTVVITATSMIDEDVSASSTLTTVVVVPEPEEFFLFMPIVFKN